jgi:hypothetical protein
MSFLKIRNVSQENKIYSKIKVFKNRTHRKILEIVGRRN